MGFWLGSGTRHGRRSLATGQIRGGRRARGQVRADKGRTQMKQDGHQNPKWQSGRGYLCRMNKRRRIGIGNRTGNRGKAGEFGLGRKRTHRMNRTTPGSRKESQFPPCWSLAVWQTGDSRRQTPPMLLTLAEHDKTKSQVRR